MTDGTITVLLADDHPLILAGMRSFLSRDAGIVIVGEASDGLEALRMATELRPDIIVLDMSMPEMNGVTVARKLHEAGSTCKVIALTVHEEAAYLRQLLEIHMAGYVLKRSAANDLVQAIRAVAAGRLYFDPSIAAQIVESTMRRGQTPAALQELSAREKDVLRLAALGYSVKAIAAELSLGAKTIETYKNRAMEKLGFHSRVELVRYATVKGWLTGS